MNWYTLLGLIFCSSVATGIRDYYQGVFNRNDLLVAQDTLYKEKAHYSLATATYVRYFKCPISYYRVMDRLGMGRGPRIQRVRGGLKENFLLLRLTSAFNTPISVNIYVACANYDFKAGSPIYTRTPWSRAPSTSATTTTAGTRKGKADDTSKSAASTDADAETAGTTDDATSGTTDDATTGGETETSGTDAASETADTTASEAEEPITTTTTTEEPAAK